MGPVLKVVILVLYGFNYRDSELGAHTSGRRIYF